MSRIHDNYRDASAGFVPRTRGMKMNAMGERQAQILELMKQNAYLTFKDLADRLNVSTITIRRDVEKLELTAGLKVALGGIINSGFFDIDARLHERVEQKRSIGAACARLIGRGQSVFVDSGSTTYYVLQALRGTPEITTIGVDLKHSALFRDLPMAEHYLAGGQFHDDTQQMVGPLAEEFLKRFRTDVAIIACTAVSPAGTLGCNVSWEVPLKRVMLEQAARRILVVDSSKFAREALLSFADIDRINMVVTDVSPPEHILHLIEDHRIELIIAA